jgi:hypothetical protein
MEEASVTIRFDLTSFADKMYRWREVSERRNTVSVGFLPNNPYDFLS